MKFTAATEKAIDAAGEQGLGEPVAVIYVFPGESFVAVGDTDRDHESVSRTLIETSLYELGRHYRKEQGR